MKKPKLKLVDQTPPNSSAPPSTLAEAGRTLWSTILAEYAVEDGAGRAMLAQACSAMDRITEFAAAIDQDGATIRTKAGLREHPLLKHELAARAFVVRTLGRLGLDIEPVKTIGRPPAPTGWMPNADE